MEEPLKIAVLGLGYVGMTAAACLASEGHDVVGVDPNRSKLDIVNDGRSPIQEPGLEDLVSAAVKDGRLRAQSELDQLVAECELAIVCVGTPSAADGSHNMGFIAEVSRQLAHLLSQHPTARMTVAYRSTIRPGSIEELIAPIFDAALGAESSRARIVYNPEFLRESTAISDYFNPPKIVVGTSDGLPDPVMDRIHMNLDAQVFTVGYRESEVTKFVDNTFHALKTTFANEIGRVCGELGISAAAVHEIFVSDTKLNVSPYYLRPGGPFGGSCLPKDVRALQHIAKSAGAATPAINALIESNEAHKTFIFEMATAGLDDGAEVLLLGLAFKDKTDDLRESPNIDLARSIIDAGYRLAIYDPYVSPENLMGQNLGVLSGSPFVRDLLVSKETAESRTWDRVIDSRSIAADLDLDLALVADVNRLA
ncbi:MULTISPECIES: nucleotide sugar dehydrogenase [unclassified Aeromicrobium]|uniref:nucleotide sugar dehydrogenase n=1 Tax=unclassified Aeromicrobium TaxID=2633570 RepID=UPI00288BBE1D|nr:MULTISPECIES: nucleotide sugar dehydrogenase [unclassified Aeromicrobium]